MSDVLLKTIDSQAIEINGDGGITDLVNSREDLELVSDCENIDVKATVHNGIKNKIVKGSKNKHKRLVAEEQGKITKHVDSGSVKTSSSRSKRKSAKKSQEVIIDLEEEQQKSKPKRKYRLSLNSEVKTKNKGKEDNNQGTIKSFFQTLSPRTQDNQKEEVEKNAESLNKSNHEKETENLVVINGDKDKNDLVSVKIKKESAGNKKKIQRNEDHAMKNSKLSSESVEENGRSSKSKKKRKKKEKNVTSTSKTLSNASIVEEIVDPTHEENNIQGEIESDDKELRKVTFSEDVEEFSPEPIRKNPILVEDKNEISENSEETKINEETTEQTKNKIRNAFSFMMDSRFKSIGQNSSGKEPEKLEESPEMHKETKKKILSRKAILEEWANSKGARKRKIEDEEQGIIIENKLKKRAKRLKKLLTNIDDKKSTRITESDSEQVIEPKEKRKRKSESKEKALDEEIDESQVVKVKSKKPKLLICSDNSNTESDVILEDKIKNNNSAALFQQTELSSFFGILEKNEKSTKKIKTKLQMNNHKKTNLQSKLTLKKHDDSHTTVDDVSNFKMDSKFVEQEEIGLEEETKILTPLTPNSIKQWKMKLKVSLANVADEDIEKLMQSPKRITESDDDDDNAEGVQKIKKNTTQILINSESDSDDEPLSSKTYYKEKNIKPVKLAPLFIKSKPKPKLDEATIEARKKFLHSTIPDSLKKNIEKQQSIEELDYQIFPTISHITVKPTPEQLKNNFWNLPKVELQLTSLESYSPSIGLLNLGSVTSSTALNNPELDLQAAQKITNIKNHLNQIKIENPNYPVYKAFKFLYQKFLKNNPEREITISESLPKKSKKGRSKKKKSEEIQAKIPQKHEIWTDLYKPNTSEEIFGNSSSISEFKTWLETWLELSEEINLQRNKKKRRNSDSSDFESTDAESKDSMRLPGNTLIFCGPHGSGKTTAVYALCNELGINVLELNASSKRTGKRLLQELQEATQSHQVRKNDANPLTTYLKKESSSSSKTSQKMCLLLIEDVDIAFEQDENFITALSQLLTTSKRPIVLTTTDINCLHLKKFVAQHSVINFSNFSPKILATWFQIICLIEGLCVERQTIVELLEWNKGDVRRTLLQLQFWVQSGGQLKISKEIYPLITKIFSSDENLVNDDNSNISWLPEEETSTETVIHRNCLESFGVFKKFDRLFTFCPVDLGNFWSKIPDLIEIPSPLRFRSKTNDVANENEEKPELFVNKSESKHLKNILNIFETLAITDTIYKKLNIDCDLEPVHRSKNNFIKDSLELNESMEDYCSNKDLAYEWSHKLLDGYVNLYEVDERQEDNSIGDHKCWRTKQNKCDEVLSEAVPIICHLDHNSVNMDYLSTIRTMARSEMVRASNNNKRRNRFYNYLRGIGINGNDSLLQTACTTFLHEY